MNMFWNIIGLAQPAGEPQSARRAELWGLIVCAYNFIFTTYFTFASGSTMPLATSIALVITFFVFSIAPLVLTLIATRRGSMIACWLAIALFLRPAALTILRIIETPSYASNLLSWELGFSISVPLIPVYFLLQPATKAWIEEKQAARKARKQDK